MREAKASTTPRHLRCQRLILASATRTMDEYVVNARHKTCKQRATLTEYGLESSASVLFPRALPEVALLGCKVFAPRTVEIDACMLLPTPPTPPPALLLELLLVAPMLDCLLSFPLFTLSFVLRFWVRLCMLARVRGL